MRKKGRLSFKFTVLLMVFTAVTLMASGIMTYISQMNIYEAQCEESIRNIGVYLKYLMEGEQEDTIYYTDYLLKHSKDIDIPSDYTDYWDAKVEFDHLFNEHHPNKTLGEDIAISEMDDEVQRAYFTYEQEYWFLVFENAREAFHVPYAYYVVPPNDTEDVMYVIDCIREAREDEPEYLNLGITGNYKKEEHENLWKVWETGEIQDGYDVFDNDFGHTYAYYVPVVIGGKTVGVIGTEIEVDRVNHEILINTVKQMGMIAMVMVTCVLVLMIYINENFIAKIMRMAYAVGDYKENKNSDIAGIFIQDAGGSDELATLADETASMMFEIASYIRSLATATRKLDDTRHEAERMEEEAQKMEVVAHTDALTGVGNKLAYDIESEKLEDELKNGHTRFGISMVDMNFLKMINDTYGHEKGDTAIRKLARLIVEVFPNSKVFRIGGDEFAVVMRGPDIGNIRILVHVFNQRLLVDKCEEPWEHISAAIGYALYDPKQDKTIADTLKRADAAMYAQKKEMKAVRKE